MIPTVEVTVTGRGGSIIYREGAYSIVFDWEYALSPAHALVWGPSRAEWNALFPWAAGRQQWIYEFVGSEIVRQKAPDGDFEYDLDAGDLTILNGSGPRARRRAAERAAIAAEEMRQHVSIDARLAAAEEMARDGRLASI